MTRSRWRRSLATRDGFPLVRGLALYERYVRSALAGLAGLPVFVCRYEEALEDPTAFAKSVAHFLDGTGVAVDTEQQLAPARALDENLHHVHAESEDVASFQLVLPAIRALDEALEAIVGPHPCFAPPALGPESEWTTSLLDLERDLQHVLDGLVWATRQIEPILRATPRPEQAALRTEGQEEDDVEGAAEGAEPDENGPYPLNASEDRRAYHRWLRARRQPVIVGGVGETPRRRARARRPLRLRTKPPLVSVLVPVWRPPLWALERCVGSVLDQTFGDWELCICDDASGDEDLTAYLRSLRRVDRRINVTALPENGGISAATNGALAIAKGRFVAFLDHDDELTSEHAREGGRGAGRRARRRPALLRRGQGRRRRRALRPTLQAGVVPGPAVVVPVPRPSHGHPARPRRRARRPALGLRREPGLRPGAAGDRARAQDRPPPRGPLPLADAPRLGGERLLGRARQALGLRGGAAGDPGHPRAARRGGRGDAADPTSPAATTCAASSAATRS